jgi:hypothetical protein
MTELSFIIRGEPKRDHHLELFVCYYLFHPLLRNALLASRCLAMDCFVIIFFTVTAMRTTNPSYYYCVQFEVLVALTVKNAMFCIPCRLVEVHRSDGGTYCCACSLDLAGCVLTLFLDPECGSGMFLRNVS